MMRPENNTHPLLNPLVAYEIMRQLPRNDVLKCRLVCGPWDTEACRYLRKTFTLDFYDLCQVHKFHATLDQSAEVKGETRDLPFSRIHLRASFRLGHSLAQEFFKNHGHIIRHLTILKVGCDCGANFFQKLLFYQANNLISLNLQIISAPIRLSPESAYYGTLRSIQGPCSTGPLELLSLRKLHLRHQLFVERPHFIKELLKATPNLESLTTDPASPDFCTSVFLPIVLNSRGSWSKLKRLLCGNSLTFTESQIDVLCSKPIHFEELRIHFNHKSPNLESIPRESLVRLLKNTCHSLKQLELSNRETEISFELDFIPKMPKLTSLRLVNITLEPRWLEVLPQLKTFEFLEEDRTGLCVPLGNLGSSPMYPVLTRLVLSPMCILNLTDMNDMGFWWNINGRFYIRRISQAFPKLKSLSLNGNDALLKGIYEEFPQLESLNIHGPITDEGLTGIPLQLCEMMHYEQNYDIDSDRIVESKFIGDLTKLRSLVIVPPVKSNLTEVSVFFGLICCKDLVHLELNNPELMKLWKEEVNRLVETHDPT